MGSSLRNRLLSWLIVRHPRLFLRAKGLRVHRLAEAEAFLALHAELVREGEGLTTLRERYNLWSLARRVAHLPGACAEVGVYRGASAVFLAAGRGPAPLHLFDTFAGLPAPEAERDGHFRAGQLAATSVPEVEARLARWPGIVIHPGLFPETAHGLESEQFKLVHLDVDLHRSTLAGLEFFYPRLIRGGHLIVHDYNDCSVPGAKSAVDEFLVRRPETLIELWDTQVLIVKQ